MAAIAFRCAQCGATAACDVARLPAYGARVRCAECGSLMPLVLLPASAEAPAPAEPRARAALPP
jgi:DNA-directed RNA polymerase subunit RPC12/RpoP